MSDAAEKLFTSHLISPRYFISFPRDQMGQGHEVSENLPEKDQQLCLPRDKSFFVCLKSNLRSCTFEFNIEYVCTSQKGLKEFSRQGDEPFTCQADGGNSTFVAFRRSICLPWPLKCVCMDTHFRDSSERNPTLLTAVRRCLDNRKTQHEEMTCFGLSSFTKSEYFSRYFVELTHSRVSGRHFTEAWHSSSRCAVYQLGGSWNCSEIHCSPQVGGEEKTRRILSLVNFFFRLLLVFCVFALLAA